MTFLTFQELVPTLELRRPGETYFSDTTTAYDRLPADWKVRLEGLTGFYTWLKWVPSVPGIEGSEHERMVKGVHHPIISTHPETGR